MSAARKLAESGFFQELRRFDFGAPTRVVTTDGVPYYVSAFWTAGQRRAHPLHEISYRACFKPQLPAFFIDRLTQPGDVVCDPFMGRGTTVLQAALMGRLPIGSDANPLSLMLTQPRLGPPALCEVEARLAAAPWGRGEVERQDLLVFYHTDTLRQICALRRYLLIRANDGRLDAVDNWIRMVALNRLTGHSPGFFSVYTMPPNQAVSVKAQLKINARRDQKPPRRDIAELIANKSRVLLAEGAPTACDAQLAVADAAHLEHIADATVDLVVTSPPFLDVVDYRGDNWLRNWFAGNRRREHPPLAASRAGRLARDDFATFLRNWRES